MNNMAILRLITLMCMLLLSIGSCFASCSSDEIKQVRTHALNAYQQGDYKAAERVLSQYYSEQCDFYYMSKESDKTFNEGLWLISDLMLYRSKLDDQLGCLALEDDVYMSWMLSDPNRHDARVEKAIRANAAQCRKTLNKQYAVAQKCPVKGHGNMYAIPDAWREQNEEWYEVACVRFIENTRNVVGHQRDLPKHQSEGMNSVAKLDLLYVSHVTSNERNSNNESNWLKHYQLDPIYFTAEDGTLWGAKYCYSFNLRFGKKAGRILLDGGSHFCSGGAASFINRVIVELDYPLRAKIVEARTHTVK